LLLSGDSKDETSAILVEGELARPQSVGFDGLLERSERGATETGNESPIHEFRI